MSKIAKQLDQLYKIDENGVGLDLSTLTYCPDPEILDNFGYVHTKIGTCNDHTISAFTEETVNKRLVTEINYTDLLEYSITTHLSAIGRSWIDILELPTTVNWDANLITGLKSLEMSGLVYGVSIKNPESVEDIEKIQKVLNEGGVELEYVSLDLCPINFNYDIVSWCENNKVAIIGYNPMGGYINSANVINSFSVPYLLGFAATHCNIVFLSSRDVYKSTLSAKYLNSMSGMWTESIYILKKNVKKLQKPLKRVVFTSAILGEDRHIPFNTPEFVPFDNNVSISLGKPHEITPEIEENAESELEIMVEEFKKTIQYPMETTAEEKFYIAQSKIIGHIKDKYKDYDFYCSMINDTTIAIRAEKVTTVGLFVQETLIDTMECVISMNQNGTIFFKG